MSLDKLLTLTTSPQRVALRLDQAARLEAAAVPDEAVSVLCRVATSGRLTLEDVLRLHELGIDIDSLDGGGA